MAMAVPGWLNNQCPPPRPIIVSLFELENVFIFSSRALMALALPQQVAEAVAYYTDIRKVGINNKNEQRLRYYPWDIC